MESPYFVCLREELERLAIDEMKGLPEQDAEARLQKIADDFAGGDLFQLRKIVRETWPEAVSA